MGEHTGQQLIDAFYKALGLMKLEQCQELLQALEELARQEPAYQGWCILFTGILANYRRRDWAEGERLFRSLLDMDPEPSLRGRVLIALGVTYRHLGRWREAIKVYEQCLTVFNQPDQAIDRAKVWKNMAIVLELGFSQGEFGDEALQQAVGYCQLALETLQVLENPNEDELWLEATTWNTLGLVYRSLGDWSQATHCYERFITLVQTLGSRYDIGAASHNLGEVLQRQGPGKWPEAQQAYLKALEIYHEFGDRYNQSDLLTDLGSLHQEMGEPDRALNYYDQALALAESIRVRLTAPTTQADYRTTIESIYTAPLSLHLQRGDAARAFTAAERARSRVLADLLAGQAARPYAEIPGHLLERRAALRQALDQAYAERPPPADLPHLEESLADLDRQIELLDPTYASLEKVASLTTEEVGERLPPGSALLAYAGDTDDRLWILVVTTAGVRAEPVKNVSVRWLRGYLARLLDTGRRSSLMPDPQTGHLLPPHLFSSLYQALIAPVWDTLQVIQTVYIVPFGPLHYLPLGALTSDLSAPPPFLAQGRRVVYAPSATILLDYCHARPPSSQQGLLAVAPHDERLQFTFGVAETIARRGGDLPLIGPAATRQAFLAQAGRYRVLCFLGHAFFDQHYPMSSRLKLADGSLHASEILRELRLQADLVILSACETGRSRVLRGDEILGLSRAVLYAGTPALLVTLWPVHEIPTRLLVEKLIEHLPLVHPDAPFDPALALAATQRWLRTLSWAEAKALLAGWEDLSAAEAESHLTALWQMTHPGEAPQAESQLFAHPFFWSPYILIGEGKRGNTNDQEV